MKSLNKMKAISKMKIKKHYESAVSVLLFLLYTEIKSNVNVSTGSSGPGDDGTNDDILICFDKTGNTKENN